MKLFYICMIFLFVLFSFSACTNHIPQPTEPSVPTQPSESSVPTQPQAPSILTRADLKEIEDYLNDVENNGFIGINCYNSPSEIQLLWVFCNGAGIQLEKDQWAEGEVEAVMKAPGWSEFQSPAAKIPCKAANALLLEKCGLSLDAWKNFPYGYVEAYDAYYYTHSEGSRFPVTIESGQIDKNGQYIIRYTVSDGCLTNDKYTVTLHKTDKGYQFISNIDVADDYDPYAIHEISADKLTVDGTKKTYKGQNITVSVPVDWLALEQHGEDGITYFFRDPTSDRCQLTFYSTGSQFAIHRTEAEYLALFSRWGYENVNILSCTKEKISGYDCTKVVYSYTVEGTAYIVTRYDNVITGLCMYTFSTDYPTAESERFASIFGSVMDSIVLQPY